MSEFTFEEEKPTKSKMVNVLSIFTFIGSAFAALAVPISMAMMKFANKMIESNPQALESMTAKQKADFEKSQSLFTLMAANQTILLIVSIVGAALCIYGAIQMRKLKKEGFYIYVLGEIVPILVTGFVIGFATQFTNVGSYIMGFGIPALFIVLYGTQLKLMK